jgi:hypothetical protein
MLISIIGFWACDCLVLCRKPRQVENVAVCCARVTERKNAGRMPAPPRWINLCSWPRPGKHRPYEDRAYFFT